MLTDISLKLKEYKTPFIRILNFLYQPYKCLIFVPFFGLMTLLCSLVIPFIAFSPKKLDILAIIWSRISLFITPVYTSIKGRENIDKNRAYVIAANHASQFDIFIMYGWIGIPFKWVMKEELRKMPVIGKFCETAGHIFINRSNPKEAVSIINQAKDSLAKTNTSILFFPEGTRSLDGNVKPFKKGAFIFAKEMGFPILPVTIKGTHSILPSKTANLFPGKAELIIHEPIETTEYNDNNIDLLISKTKNIIEKPLN